MASYPDCQNFKRLAENDSVVPVFMEIPWQSPFSAYKKIAGPNSFILESVSGPLKIARFSIIGAQPFLIFKSKGRFCQLTNADGETSTLIGEPFILLKELLRQYKVEAESRFCGGAVGYLSYDAGRFFEKLPNLAKDDLSLPDMVFFFTDTFALFDHGNKKAKVFSLAFGDRGSDSPKLAQEKALALKEQLSAKCRLEPDLIKGVSSANGRPPSFDSNFSKEAFKEIVKIAKEYIQAGDIYQVNLSQRLATPLSLEPLEIYGVLREINPSPFAGFFDFGDWQMVSCSPERLVKLEKRFIETRPIAGTVRRSLNKQIDQKLINRLILDFKERAEHIMLVDLERNDLGRVSDYGTVRVDELMITESYSHVTHIVSNVTGTLHGDKDQFDLLRACFPGGTITGCPKIRAMEIIEELEPVKRGPYTGSMGYFGFNGNMDLNIIIRTLIIKDGWAFVQAGAGIVADSQPEKEYFETLYKAEALIKATKLAEAKVRC